MCFSSQYSYGGCLFILVRFLSYGVGCLQMWALVRRLSGGIAPWCVGVGDSRACCALFGGVLRVGTYSRWGGDEEPLRQVAVRLEICSRGKHGKGEKKSGVSGDLTNWYTGVSLGIGTRVYQRKHPKERWPEETSQAAKRIEIQRSSRFVFGNRKAVVNNRKAAKDSRKITEK